MLEFRGAAGADFFASAARESKPGDFGDDELLLLFAELELNDVDGRLVDELLLLEKELRELLLRLKLVLPEDE